MELDEFIDTSVSVTERLVAKLDPDPAMGRYTQSIRGNSAAGEWQIAMEDLVALLNQNRIPVTATELRDLKAVFTYLSNSRSDDVRVRAETSLTRDIANLTTG